MPTDLVTESNQSIKIVNTPPTRGDIKLDLCLSYFGDEIAETFVTSPLSNKNGIFSDHAVLVLEDRMLRTHQFNWVRYRSRVVIPEGKSRFMNFLTNVNWEKEMSHMIPPSFTPS